MMRNKVDIYKQKHQQLSQNMQGQGLGSKTKFKQMQKIKQPALLICVFYVQSTEESTGDEIE